MPARTFLAPALALLALAPIAAWAPAAPALAGAPERLAFAAPSKVWLTGDSTLHPYSSTSTRLGGGVTVTRGADGQARYVDLDVVIPVTTLKSGNGQLDDNMYRALQAAKHPTIRFAAAGGPFTVSPAGAVKVEAKGRLTIAGAAQDVAVTTTGRLADEVYRLAGKQELLMSAFGIAPPVLMGGLIRCSDRIVVHYDLVAKAR